jgi:hypothetical protein
VRIRRRLCQRRSYDAAAQLRRQVEGCRQARSFRATRHQFIRGGCARRVCACMKLCMYAHCVRGACDRRSNQRYVCVGRQATTGTHSTSHERTSDTIGFCVYWCVRLRVLTLLKIALQMDDLVDHAAALRYIAYVADTSQHTSRVHHPPLPHPNADRYHLPTPTRTFDSTARRC